MGKNRAPISLENYAASSPYGVSGIQAGPVASPPPADGVAAGTNRKRKFLLFAIVAVVGIAGVTIGVLSSNGSLGAGLDATNDIGKRLDSLFKEKPYLAENPTMRSMSLLTQAIDTYKEQGTVPSSAVSARDADGSSATELFNILDEAAPGDARRLRGELAKSENIFDRDPEEWFGYSQLHSAMARELQSSSINVANTLYYFVSRGVENMSGTASNVRDIVGISMVGRNCYVIPKETNDLTDWYQNLNQGTTRIQGIRTTNLAAFGYEGFTRAYNAMRLQIWSQMGRQCSGATQYTFGGWSRGGGIASVMAAAMQVENLISGYKINFVTYGAPRALTASTARKLRFNMQYRFVNAKDPVPSVPYTWLSSGNDPFTHIGYMRCKSCRYSLDRNAPYYGRPSDILDHLKYNQIFPLTRLSTSAAHIQI